MQPEFSKVFDLEHTSFIDTHQFEATPQECAALAKRFELAAIHFFKCNVTVRTDETYGRGFKVTGHIQADVVQRCITTLQDVPENINTTFETRILPRKLEASFTEEQLDSEDFEFFTLPEIDLGEICAQYLSLELNPYPRAGDVQGDVIQEKRHNPFDILKKLKEKS